MSVDSIFSADCYCHKNDVNVWNWIVKKTCVKCNLISFAYPNCIASCEYCSRLATKPQWLVYRVVDWLDVRTLDERMRGFQTRWLTCRRVHRFSKTAQNPDRIAVVIYCCTQRFKVHMLFPSVNISITIQKPTGFLNCMHKAISVIAFVPSNDHLVRKKWPTCGFLFSIPLIILESVWWNNLPALSFSDSALQSTYWNSSYWRFGTARSTRTQNHQDLDYVSVSDHYCILTTIIFSPESRLQAINHFCCKVDQLRWISPKGNWKGNRKHQEIPGSPERCLADQNFPCQRACDLGRHLCCLQPVDGVQTGTWSYIPVCSSF